jgi:predicted RNA-binding protein YlqC (UPF0109 family)
MKEFLEFLIQPLLTTPDEIEIDILGSIATVKIAQSDMGRVIGKHGTIIAAIRTLSKTFASLHQLPPMSVNLLERA